MKKIGSEAKNNAGTTSRIAKKNMQDEKFLHKLFLTKKKNKIRNGFAKNTSTDRKLSKE